MCGHFRGFLSPQLSTTRNLKTQLFQMGKKSKSKNIQEDEVTEVSIAAEPEKLSKKQQKKLANADNNGDDDVSSSKPEKLSKKQQRKEMKSKNADSDEEATKKSNKKKGKKNIGDSDDDQKSDNEEKPQVENTQKPAKK
mgnify:CR=1 FL=1